MSKLSFILWQTLTEPFFNIRREKRDIPFIMTSCIREVERRGMLEVGIYRVSGSASDLARLKKAFETSKFILLIWSSPANVFCL